MRPAKRVRREHGVSLIEALIALVVMSIGMLGIAALYIESIKANRSAVLRTQAIALANDMADRIRANRLAGNRYALALGAAPPAAQGCINNGSASTNNCTQNQLADDDLNRWVATVRATLPANGATPPRTGVTYTGAPGVGMPDAYAIILTWREPNQDPAEADFRYQLNLQLIPVTPT